MPRPEQAIRPGTNGHAEANGRVLVQGVTATNGHAATNGHVVAPAQVATNGHVATVAPAVAIPAEQAESVRLFERLAGPPRRGKRGLHVLQAFPSALRAIRANKGRSVLTTLGIVIGVAAVIAIVALGQGAS